MNDLNKTLPHHHSEIENILVENMPNSETIQKVADAMKLLGDPSRLEIFWMLCHCEECVINIASLMNMTSPADAHHLKLLKTGQLITSRREGKEMYYTAAKSEIVDFLHESIEKLGNLTCPHI